MKCIVTGGAGFIGSQIVDLLIDMGMNVSVVDDLSTGSESNLNPLAELHKINILDSSALESVCQDVDLFFHTAAWARIQPSFDQPFEHEQTNVIGTIRCLQAVMGKRLTKFVLSSSSAIYGDTTTLPIQESCPPNILSPYALQKYAAEQYCLVLGRRFNIPVIALRYFNVYGPRSINPPIRREAPTAPSRGYSPANTERVNPLPLQEMASSPETSYTPGMLLMQIWKPLFPIGPLRCITLVLESASQ